MDGSLKFLTFIAVADPYHAVAGLPTGVENPDYIAGSKFAIGWRLRAMP